MQHLLSSTLSLICTDKRAANGTGYLQRRESGGGLWGLSGQKIKELAFHIRSLLPQTLTTQQTVPKTCSAHCYGFLSLYILCTFYFFFISSLQFPFLCVFCISLQSWLVWQALVSCFLPFQIHQEISVLKPETFNSPYWTGDKWHSTISRCRRIKSVLHTCQLTAAFVRHHRLHSKWNIMESIPFN